MRGRFPARHAAAALSAALVAIALLAIGCSDSSLEVQVQFDDVAGLEIGNPVQVSGLQIGRVKKMDLLPEGEVDVTVEIDQQYRDRVTERSVLWLRRQSWLSAQRYLELEQKEGNVAEFGARLAGRSGSADLLQGWLDDLQHALDDPAIREKVDEFGKSLDELAEQGREEWERLRPELEDHAERLLEEAEREGSEIVEELRRELEGLLEDFEENENEPIRQDV